MSDCSAVSTWPNWTGAAVCWTGIVVALVQPGAVGEPGLTSTK